METSRVIGVLNDDEARLLQLLESEIQRAALVHDALVEKRLSAMRAVISSRGESLEDSYTIDAQRGVISRVEPAADSDTAPEASASPQTSE